MTERILPESFTSEELAALIELYGNQYIQDFKNFKKAVYTFSFYQGDVPKNAPNYDQLLKEVMVAQSKLKREAQRVLSGEVIALGDCVDG